ncbi:MAG: hypothetical protein EZS28_009552 [Streblomastix strix]|uniref:Uncharacterized protein n=1 Tax=Streblomastix strix TaxID=222440 RepID=A0A5J4WJ10_9EUKA|nr:MAG: hypothetical protein EZS28_009552 [Streblomastix strix]
MCITTIQFTQSAYGEQWQGEFAEIAAQFREQYYYQQQQQKQQQQQQFPTNEQTDSPQALNVKRYYAVVTKTEGTIPLIKCTAQPGFPGYLKQLNPKFNQKTAFAVSSGLVV